MRRNAPHIFSFYKEAVMERRERIFRIGKTVLIGALVLVLAAPVSKLAAKLFSDPRAAAFLVYLETGRVVRLDTEPLLPTQTRPAEKETEPPARKISFLAQEKSLIKLSNFTQHSPNVEELLTSTLSWDLTAEGPAVLILHTHATESYADISGYRTEDADRNMLRVGQEMAKILEENGIGVIHDTTLHDQPSYNGSYSYARRTIEAYLEKYPSIRMVLDVHRDALELSETEQLSTHARVDGQDSAQLMLVMGTNAGGLYHPAWQENLSVGLKIQALLERQYPGICRPLQLRTERFNQDLSAAGMIIEVGAAGDTLEKALVAAGAFARAIVTLARGTA